MTLRTTTGLEVTYVHLVLGLSPMPEELARLDAVLRSSHRNRSRRGGEGDSTTRYSTLLKAANLAWPYIRQPYFARWLLRRSQVVVQDETGLTPSAYDDDTHKRGH